MNQQSGAKKCSFCGSGLLSNNFFSGIDNTKLCFKCIYNSKEVLDKKIQVETSKSNVFNLNKKIKKPSEIFNSLDKYVIGQNEAKKTLSVAIYNHFNRLINNLKESDLEIEKSNVLLIGPSGSGKTLLAKTLAKIVDLPFVITDATTLTEAGYVGDDVENILLRLIEKSDHNIELAQKGIIFIDEIDKIGRKSESVSITRDVSGEGVQQALLKIIEGTISSVPVKGGRKHPQSENLKINTKDILFICGGAFIGIDKIIENRTNHSPIGFKHPFMDEKKKYHGKANEVLPEDLIKYGMIPELVGRLPSITTLDELSSDDLRKIILEPKNSLFAQFRKLLSYDDIDLEITEEAIDFLIKEANEVKLGARMIKGVFERIMREAIFIAPEHKGESLVLTPENIKSKNYFKKN